MSHSQQHQEQLHKFKQQINDLQALRSKIYNLCETLPEGHIQDTTIKETVNTHRQLVSIIDKTIKAIKHPNLPQKHYDTISQEITQSFQQYFQIIQTLESNIKSPTNKQHTHETHAIIQKILDLKTINKNIHKACDNIPDLETKRQTIKRITQLNQSLIDTIDIIQPFIKKGKEIPTNLHNKVKQQLSHLQTQYTSVVDQLESYSNRNTHKKTRDNRPLYKQNSTLSYTEKHQLDGNTSPSLLTKLLKNTSQELQDQYQKLANNIHKTKQELAHAKSKSSQPQTTKLPPQKTIIKKTIICVKNIFQIVTRRHKAPPPIITPIQSQRAFCVTPIQPIRHNPTPHHTIRALTPPPIQHLPPQYSIRHALPHSNRNIIAL